MSQHNQRHIVVWLGVCSAMIFAMVLLGGAVRVTGSGLSMTDWKLLMGALPPLDHAAWSQAFEQYKQFPEYKILNRGMDLGQFRFIYLMEYAHRVLGRLIGLVFLIPFIWFLAIRKINPVLQPRLWALFALGAIQGGIGWYMVKSGLVDDPHVSQYRLTLHLMIAVLIYVYMVRIMAGLVPERCNLAPAANRFGYLVLSVALVMVASGGLVAGTRAGYILNTFPTMGGEWVPAQVTAMSPLWKNFFENPITVQWVHRAMAMVVFVVVVVYAIGLLRQKQIRYLNVLGTALLIAVFVQILLGISTLLLSVPPMLAVAHQAGAMALLTLLVLGISAGYPPLEVAGSHDSPAGSSRQ